MQMIMILVVTLMLTGCWEFSEGEKVGTIIKFAKQGFICKTWEATIVRGGFSDGSGNAGTTVSYFTVSDEKLVAVVQGYMESQTEVKVRYKSEVLTLCRSDDEANRFLVSIEPIKK